jgi:hypothetical protein
MLILKLGQIIDISFHDDEQIVRFVMGGKVRLGELLRHDGTLTMNEGLDMQKADETKGEMK